MNTAQLALLDSWINDYKTGLYNSTETDDAERHASWEVLNTLRSIRRELIKLGYGNG